MNTLTKDQVQKLTPEQQDAIASIVTSDFRWMQELLKQARPRWFPRIAAGLMLAVAVGSSMYQVGTTPVFPLCVVLLAFSIQMHAHAQHQRLDALMKLLDAELRRRPDKQEPA